MPMKKHELLSQLENARNNYILGLGGYYMYRTGKHHDVLRNATLVDSDNSKFKLDSIRLFGERDLSIAREEFFKSTFRLFISEMKECIHQYAKQSGQMITLYTNCHFRVARILRNAVAHDFKIHLDKHDRNALPIEFCGVVYNEDMHGQPLTFEMIKPNAAMQLHEELVKFVRADLK